MGWAHIIAIGKICLLFFFDCFHGPSEIGKQLARRIALLHHRWDACLLA